MWFFVSLTQSSIAKFPGSIPIKALNTPSGLTAIYDQKTVDIKIMAQAVTWRELSPDSFTAYVDLTNYKAGTYQVLVNVTSTIPGVSVTDRSPDKILVTLEPVIKKDVSLDKKIEGNAADGLVAGNISLSADKVQISGPESELNTITEAFVQISLSGEQSNIEKIYPIYVYNSNGEVIKDVEITPKEINVTVPIIKASNSKTVGVKVVTTGQPKTGFYVSSISVKPSTVDIIGQNQTVQDVKFLETAPIDLTGLSTDLDKEISLALPDGITITPGTSNKVEVTMSFSANEVTKELSVSNISAVNLTGYKIKDLLSAPVKVMCSGTADAINALKSTDISIIVDFQGISVSAPGTKSFDLNKNSFKLPNGISVLSVVPSTVNVEIIAN